MPPLKVFRGRDCTRFSDVSQGVFPRNLSPCPIFNTAGPLFQDGRGDNMSSYGRGVFLSGFSHISLPVCPKITMNILFLGKVDYM
jgi:hypothetical protein